MADHPLIQSSTDIEDGCVFGRSDENSTMVPTQSVDVERMRSLLKDLV